MTSVQVIFSLLYGSTKLFDDWTINADECKINTFNKINIPPEYRNYKGYATDQIRIMVITYVCNQKVPQSSRQCVSLLDVKPKFELQVRSRTKYKKNSFGEFFSADFWQKL